MSRKIPTLVALAAISATTLAITSSGGAQAPSETVLSYTVRPAGGTFVDSKPKGDSRGDFVVFEDRLQPASASSAANAGRASSPTLAPT